MRMPLSLSTTAELHLAPLLLGLPFQKRGQFILEFGEHRTGVGIAFELSLEGRDIGTQVHVFGSLRRIAKFLGRSISFLAVCTSVCAAALSLWL